MDKKTRRNYKLLLYFLILLLIAINYPIIDRAVKGYFIDYEVGIVERVIDGDTIVVNGTTVRLLGINCPEKGERYYGEAKEYLEEGLFDLAENFIAKSKEELPLTPERKNQAVKDIEERVEKEILTTIELAKLNRIAERSMKHLSPPRCNSTYSEKYFSCRVKKELRFPPDTPVPKPRRVVSSPLFPSFTFCRGSTGLKRPLIPYRGFSNIKCALPRASAPRNFRLSI